MKFLQLVIFGIAFTCISSEAVESTGDAAAAPPPDSPGSPQSAPGTDDSEILFDEDST